jgi:hypothetical protein
MNVGDIFKRLGKFTADNSPAILTAIGVAGTITTAYLAGKASFKACRVITDRQLAFDLQRGGRELTLMEKLNLVWPHYIPAIGVGCMTIGCILFANTVSNRRAAGMATAFALSERAFSEYKEKVVEKLGDSKERDIRDELAQDRVTKTSNLGEMVIIGDGSVLCYEAFTGRYFLSSMEELKRAQNNVNYKVLNDYNASLTDFYNEVDGLERTSFSDEVGWNSDELLELIFSTVLTESGKPCLSVDFKVKPIRGFYKVN